MKRAGLLQKLAIVALLLALALSTKGDIHTAAASDTVVYVDCPDRCITIEYGSAWWYMTCWPFCRASGSGGGNSGAGL